MKFYCFSCFIVLCIVITLTIYSTIRDVKKTKFTQRFVYRDPKLSVLRKKNTYPAKIKNNMKYILQWTYNSVLNMPLVYMGEGRSGFLKRNCTYNNCYVTIDKNLLGSHSKFDVIVFLGTELLTMITVKNFPITRLPHQKYVFANIESAANYDLNTNIFDEYFNWTWTYKLNSDVRWGYIVVRDLKNNIIGPKAGINWLKLEEMDPVNEDFKQRLKSKRKAAAWFASNCHTNSWREKVVVALREELQKYNHVVDIYGSCGLHVCAPDNETVCDKKIASDYYFYLSFENALSEDYVTEKLLRALQNDAVPVVYGGADYKRFMPDGIYLNAVDLGVVKLATKMIELIKDPDQYANYFRWKNHYKYEKTTDRLDTNEYCKMCAILNDDEAVKNITIYRDFRNWWGTSSENLDLYFRSILASINK